MDNLGIILGFLWDMAVVWGPWLIAVGMVWFVVFCALYKRNMS